MRFNGSLLLVASLAALAQEFTVPPGWQTRNLTDRAILTPPGIVAPDFLETHVFRARPMMGETMDQWIEVQLASGFCRPHLEGQAACTEA